MRNTLTRTSFIITATALLTLGLPLHATAQQATASRVVYTIDVSGFESRDLFNSPANQTFSVFVGAFSSVQHLAWDVELETEGDSYLSDMGLDAASNANQAFGVSFYPANEILSSGAGSFGGVIDLVVEDLEFSVGADGLLRLEFFEDFVDSDPASAADGRWKSGRVAIGVVPFTTTTVPEPGTLWLIAGSIGLLSVSRLRRTARTRRLAPLADATPPHSIRYRSPAPTADTRHAI